jgi:hypothetical protein
MEDEKSHYIYIRNTVKLLLSVKILIGCILLIFGGYIALQIVSTSLNIIIHPDKVVFLELLKKYEPQGIHIGTENSNYFISNAFFSYTVIIIILLITASIAKWIITSGIQLIQMDVKSLFEKLWKEWDDLRVERKRFKNKEYDILNG